MGTSSHDTPTNKPQYGQILGNMDKGPMPVYTGVASGKPTQETGAGVPAPGTYATGTGPTVRPEWTGRKK